jgi:hypothetical protein
MRLECWLPYVLITFIIVILIIIVVLLICNKKITLTVQPYNDEIIEKDRYTFSQTSNSSTPYEHIIQCDPSTSFKSNLTILIDSPTIDSNLYIFKNNIQKP